MAGFLTSMMLTGLLAAGPVDVFTFDGPEVTARTVGNVGFFTQGSVPFTDLYERGTGAAEFVAEDRILAPMATYGDAGRLEASFRLGATRYRVELDHVGFPPPEAGVVPVTGPRPPPPNQPISGGVVMNRWLHGDSGLGFYGMPRMLAAGALWGVGRVWRNGELLTDAAIIHAAALSQGVHADDGTFRLLPVAREEDTELHVMVWNLPAEAEPRGFLQFGFDDVAIDVDGVGIPAVAVVPTAGVPGGVAVSTTPVPGGASLGAVPNTTLSQPGVGGAGFAGTGVAGADGIRVRVGGDAAGVVQPGLVSGTEVGTVLDPFLAPPGPTDPGRVAIARPLPGQAVEQIPGDPVTPIVPEPFFNDPSRVDFFEGGAAPIGLPDEQAPGQPTVPFVTDPFFDPARVTIADELPAAPAVGGFVPLSPAPQSTFLSTRGSFSVVPLVPGVAGPGFVFGGPRVSAGLVSTPLTQASETPAVPLVSTPQPLNTVLPVPLISTPQPLNANQPVPLISNPTPLNAQPISGTPPASGAVTNAPATVPGLVPGAVQTPGAVPAR